MAEHASGRGTRSVPGDRLTPVREVFPYLCVRGAAAAIEFYVNVFGARELFRLAEPDGRVAHAELAFGPTTIMVVDEYPDLGVRSPLTFGGTGTTIHLHVDDVDELARTALEAGATMLREPTDYGHGERQCRIRDPFGHEWLLGHEIERLDPDEICRRFEAGDR